MAHGLPVNTKYFNMSVVDGWTDGWMEWNRKGGQSLELFLRDGGEV